jgi:hypothetical protein
MSTQRNKVQMLGAAVIEEMDAQYTLVFTSQRDTLPPDVVEALVGGDNAWETKGGEALWDWEGENRWSAACDAADQLAKDIVARWEREDSTDTVDADYRDLLDNQWPDSDERRHAIEAIQERDRSTWFDDLVAGHGPVLLRVGIASMDEDASLGFMPMSAPQFVELLGFDDTDHNRSVAAEIIDNASPESSVAMGYAIISADLADIVALPQEGKVELRNPHVWLGSPFAGSGWCGEKPFHGTLTVERRDLRTDNGAFGYAWADVAGGVSVGFYAGQVAPVLQPPDTTAAPECGHDNER